MTDFDAIRGKLQEIDKIISEGGRSMNVEKLRAEAEELKQQQADPDFWNDMDNAQRVNKKLKHIETAVERYDKLVKRSADSADVMELVMAEEDDELGAELSKDVDALLEDCGAFHIDALLSGEYDANDAIVSIHAGAGGTEAQDWVQMLYRMYTFYCEKKGWRCTMLDLLDGDEAGIKSVTFRVEGEYAYGYLKAEKGVHRLVRISPFDSAARRHTSFSSVDVMPELEDDAGIEINMDELRIDTYRSSGAGGQHVNKTESAIRITHLPTGIVVSCQNERSQIQNRETAFKMLRAKLVEIREREQMEKLAEIQGDLKKIEWGSQIRSYVFHPYQMVKDHRTGVETGNIGKVMDGDLEEFVRAYLIMS